MSRPPAEEKEKIPNDLRPIFQKHLAIHILLEEQKKVLNARVAANKKAAEQAGIPGKKIKVTHDLSKKPPSEIAKHYAEEVELLRFQGIDLAAQFNLFGGADITTPKKGPDYYGAGLFAALEGKDGNPPKNIKGPDQQRWQEGWNDGVTARVMGQEYLDKSEAQMKAASNDGKPDDDQVDLEEAIEGAVIRIGLSDFGPDAKLEDIELADCDLEGADVEKAQRIEIVDADGRVNILKNRNGPTGMQDGFALTQQELAAQKARPSTIAGTDAGADTTQH